MLLPLNLSGKWSSKLRVKLQVLVKLWPVQHPLHLCLFLLMRVLAAEVFTSEWPFDLRLL
jgi:hypothetical protein